MKQPTALGAFSAKPQNSNSPHKAGDASFTIDVAVQAGNQLECMLRISVVERLSCLQ